MNDLLSFYDYCFLFCLLLRSNVSEFLSLDGLERERKREREFINSLERFYTFSVVSFVLRKKLT